MKKCIAQGVTKINVNRLSLDGYRDHLKNYAAKLTQTQLMEQGVEKVVEDTVRWMEICGSAGRA